MNIADKKLAEIKRNASALNRQVNWLLERLKSPELIAASQPPKEDAGASKTNNSVHAEIKPEES
jgi:hypothetical protein